MLLRMLSESGPDIIVITGDLVDSMHTDIDTAPAFAKEAVQTARLLSIFFKRSAAGWQNLFILPCLSIASPLLYEPVYGGSYCVNPYSGNY